MNTLGLRPCTSGGGIVVPGNTYLTGCLEMDVELPLQDIDVSIQTRKIDASTVVYSVDINNPVYAVDVDSETADTAISIEKVDLDGCN